MYLKMHICSYCIWHCSVAYKRNGAKLVRALWLANLAGRISLYGPGKIESCSFHARLI